MQIVTQRPKAEESLFNLVILHNRNSSRSVLHKKKMKKDFQSQTPFYPPERSVGGLNDVVELFDFVTGSSRRIAGRLRVWKFFSL